MVKYLGAFYELRKVGYYRDQQKRDITFKTLNEINVRPEFIIRAELTPGNYTIGLETDNTNNFEPWLLKDKKEEKAEGYFGANVNNFESGINNPKCSKLAREFNFGSIEA